MTKVSGTVLIYVVLSFSFQLGMYTVYHDILFVKVNRNIDIYFIVKTLHNDMYVIWSSMPLFLQ